MPDPTRLLSPTGGPYASASDFHEMMAQQLRHAPWLALSIAIHALVVLILLLLPADRVVRSERKLALAPPDETAPLPPEPPRDVTPPEPDVAPDDPQLLDPDVVPAEDPSDLLTDVTAPDDRPSAFDYRGDNPAIGLGGGAAGPGGGRGLRRRGAPRQTVEVVERSLQWLADHQDEDGRWDADGFMKHDAGPPCDGPGNPVHDVGVTGLALLAFLADDHTLEHGRYREVVRNSVRWLRSQQQDNGRLGSDASHDFVYDHAIATLALVEACGLSRSTVLRPYAQRAIGYLEAHRNPYMVWRYQPVSGDNDTSVTGWAVLAYKSAKDFGLQVDQRAFDLSRAWFDQVTDASGRCGYTTRGTPSSRHPGDHAARFPPERGECMTAVALLCRALLGQSLEDEPRMRAGADLILAKPPAWDAAAGSIDHYYWYYGTYALYQMGGRHWREWSKALTAAVVRTQRRDASYAGSWDPAGAWGEDGGRVYSTAILTLTLQAYYRYSRVLLR